jgi:hypothetical protein
MPNDSLNIPEPAPSEPRGPAIWPLVIADAHTRFTFADPLIEDMAERDRIGTERYGVPLHANNGRNPLVDAYQESLDLMVYLRQAIEEGVGGHTIRTEYDLVLRLGKRLRYLLMSLQERERDGLISDAISVAPLRADPDAVRLEAIAAVDRHLASRQP